MGGAYSPAQASPRAQRARAWQLPCILGLLGLALSSATAACERETTPPLIEVREVSPRELEEGDHLTIQGVGFPEGKIAHIAFRGDLHRPGMPPVTGVRVDVDAMVGSSTELDLPMNAPLVKLFVGTGDRAAHTTFSGDVTVAFAAATPAAPPVAGTLHDTWVDVRPPTPHRSVAEARATEGEQTLEFLGIKPDPTPVVAGGVLIDSIEAGSRAEASRLLPADVITEFDGVRVLSTRDLAAVPGDRSAWLKIRRGGSPHEEVARLSLVGWKPRAAAALFAPVLILGVATLLLLLFFAPTPDLVAWAERQISLRLRPRGRTRVPAQDLTLTARLFGTSAGARASLRLTVVSVVSVASVLLALLPFAHYVGLADIDAGILVVLSLTALTTLALFTGPSRPRSRSILAPLHQPFRVLGLGVPALASIVLVVMMTGSLGMEDIVRAQSGWPWGWTVFKSPLAFVLVALSFVSAVLTSRSHGGGGGDGGDPLPEADASSSAASLAPAPLEGFVSGGGRAGSRLFFLAECSHLLVLSAVFAALFLGGWQIPGLAPEQIEGHFVLTLAGALLFVWKTWFIVSFVVAARWAFPSIVGHAPYVMSLCWRWLVPLSLLSLGVTAVWNARGPDTVGTETLVGAVMMGVALAGALHVVLRVRYFMNESAREAAGGVIPGMDPFL